MQKYTVKPGDTLSGIALRFHLKSWRDLYFAAENNAFRTKRTNPDRIFPGDILYIPGPAIPPAVSTKCRYVARGFGSHLAGAISDALPATPAVVATSLAPRAAQLMQRAAQAIEAVLAQYTKDTALANLVDAVAKGGTPTLTGHTTLAALQTHFKAFSPTRAGDSPPTVDQVRARLGIIQAVYRDAIVKIRRARDIFVDCEIAIRPPEDPVVLAWVPTNQENTVCFTSIFGVLGGASQLACIIHEMSHLVSQTCLVRPPEVLTCSAGIVDWAHWNPRPTGATLHSPRTYSQLETWEAMTNAYSFEQFVSNIVRGQDRDTAWNE